MEVKKNKEILSKLKTENKDLRSQLSSLMSDQGRNASSSEMNKLEKQVSDLRRSHDDVKHKLLMRQKEVLRPEYGRALLMRCSVPIATTIPPTCP
jgi:hypothetical protein